jgi:hypothetical protein
MQTMFFIGKSGLFVVEVTAKAFSARRVFKIV